MNPQPIDNYAAHKTQAIWQFPTGRSVMRLEIIGPDKLDLAEDVEAAIEFLTIAKRNIERASAIKSATGEKAPHGQSCDSLPVS